MAQERHITVPRSARYYTIGEVSSDVNDVWFVIHGYGQLAGDFVKEFEAIGDPRRLILAPEALSRYYISTAPEFHGPDAKIGATWMTRADREVEVADYVRYLDLLYEETMRAVGKARVTVLGFSQGGATANRWLTRGKAKADRLFMWGALLAADMDLNRAAAFFRDVELTLVYGTRDKFADEGMISAYQRTLDSHFIPYNVVTFEGGHRMDRDTLLRLAR
jgi:predicted esterase